MRQSFLWIAVALVISVAGTAGSAGRDASPAAGGEQGTVMAGSATRAQVIAEAERLRSSHGSPRPGGGFDAAARRRADESFRWLAVAGNRYRSDALVIDALMRTYGVMGDYYTGFYPAGAWYGYAGANRWARMHWLRDQQRTPALQRDLGRYAQGWAAIAAAQGSWFWRPPELTQDSTLPADAPGARETTFERVPVPEIDEAALTAEQRAAWRELRSQFVLVSSRVFEARGLLDQMTQRLKARGLSLNAQDGGTALSMQGFLVDAADLIKEREFAHAKEALARAEYERNRLRGTTGQ